MGYVLEYGRAFRNGMIAIHRVRSPMSGDELINYAENGHQYANGQYIPRVTSWDQTPGAYQPGMSRTYSYSPRRNFTGFPFSGGFREARTTCTWWAVTMTTGRKRPVSIARPTMRC